MASWERRIRVQPEKIRSMPIRRPIAHSAEFGQEATKIRPIRSESAPFKPSQPAPGTPRWAKAAPSRTTPARGYDGPGVGGGYGEDAEAPAAKGEDGPGVGGGYGEDGKAAPGWRKRI